SSGKYGRFCFFRITGPPPEKQAVWIRETSQRYDPPSDRMRKGKEAKPLWIGPQPRGRSFLFLACCCRFSFSFGSPPTGFPSIFPTFTDFSSGVEPSDIWCF